MKMKTAKYFDVHDHDVTPEIYTLLFSDCIVEMHGNDQWYKLPELEEIEDYVSDESFSERLARGWNNCYFDEEKMKALCDNPITGQEAVKRFVRWLKDRGVTNEDTVFVQIWW